MNTMSRAELLAQHQQALEELDSLRAARAALPLGDRERAQQLRQMIARAKADVEETEADLLAFDERERSAERKAERARGRAALAQARAADIEAFAAWKRLEDKLREATAAAHELTQATRTTAELARTAVAAHYGRDHRGMRARAEVAVPAAAGLDSGVVKGLALLLQELIAAMPCADRLAIDYFTVNAFALSVGRRTGAPRDYPTLRELLASSSDRLALNLAGLCEEPEQASEAA